MFKYSDVFSLPVLIGRLFVLIFITLSSFFFCSVFFVSLTFRLLLLGCAGVFNLAPLAQLVEHLTLNQGVRSSSLRWCTMLGDLRNQIFFYVQNTYRIWVPFYLNSFHLFTGNITYLFHTYFFMFLNCMTVSIYSS